MDSAGYRVGAEGTWRQLFDDLDGLLFHIDKDITLTVQLTRSDLFFLHAAVVALDGRAVVVAAPSGTGKSTLVLALLERGLEYPQRRTGAHRPEAVVQYTDTHTPSASKRRHRCRIDCLPMPLSAEAASTFRSRSLAGPVRWQRWRPCISSARCRALRQSAASHGGIGHCTPDCQHPQWTGTSERRHGCCART